MNNQSIEIFEQYITAVKNHAADEREKFLTDLIVSETGGDRELTKSLWEEITQLINIYRRGAVDGIREMKTSIDKMPYPIPPPPAPDRK